MLANMFAAGVVGQGGTSRTPIEFKKMNEQALAFRHMGHVHCSTEECGGNVRRHAFNDGSVLITIWPDRWGYGVHQGVCKDSICMRLLDEIFERCPISPIYLPENVLIDNIGGNLATAMVRYPAIRQFAEQLKKFERGIKVYLESEPRLEKLLERRGPVWPDLDKVLQRGIDK